MCRSVFYKEWLKIRWFLAGYTLLALCGLAYLFLTVKQGFAFSGGKSNWYDLLFSGNQFFKHLRFIPLAGGILFGFAQYIPEIIEKRLKLTFHLPVQENKILLQMNVFGGLSLLLSFLVIYGTFAGICRIYFPIQVFIACTSSVFPWFLAGLTAYFLVALVILEPAWKFRIAYVLMGGFLLSIYLKAPITAAFAPAIGGLLLLTFTLSVALLFSAYRFRKGEM